MSKLIDKLKRASEPVSRPMGFGLNRAAPPRPRLLLVASLAPAEVAKCADLAGGADAALLRFPKLAEAGALGKCAEAAPDMPWGVWLSDASGVAEKPRLAGDFVIFPLSGTPLRAFSGLKAGKILELEPSLPAGLAAAVNELPVNAVLIKQEAGSPLTWQGLALLQQFASLLSKPLLAVVPGELSGEELEMLWEAGVDGIVVAAAPGQIAKLRGAIDKASFSAKRRRGRVRALVPHISGGAERVEREAEPEPEEEEEE